jgi:hypothetical protein
MPTVVDQKNKTLTINYPIPDHKTIKVKFEDIKHLNVRNVKEKAADLWALFVVMKNGAEHFLADGDKDQVEEKCKHLAKRASVKVA